LIFAIALVLGAGAQASVAPPWRMVYSNDMTNIINCISPYNERGPRVMTEEKIRASVAEAAVEGMDAQFIQPGFSWVPWWDSKIYPLAEHEAWFKQHYGSKADRPEHRFMLKGGDIIGIFIDECHKRGVAAVLSFRANDGHLQEMAFDPPNRPGRIAHCVSRFYVEHPEYRRGALPAAAWRDRVHNWAIPEARKYKEDLLREAIQLYHALDGVEIDFQRHPYYFPDEMPMNERVQIMCDFIKKARAELDTVAQKTNGKHRYLGVRVPKWKDDYTDGTWEAVGFDPKAWADAGVDFFNLSTHFCVTQEMADAQIARDAAPNVRIFQELTNATATWRLDKGYDKHGYRRATKEMLETSARLAYARGADALSFFNFVYYREFGGMRDKIGPFDEPPFNYLPKLTDRAYLDTQPMYAFHWARDQRFVATRTFEFSMDILPAKGNGSALLRILVLTESERTFGEDQAAEKIKRGKWVVRLNGVELKPSKNPPRTAYPLPTEFKAGFDKPEQYLSFDIPANLLKDGENKIAVTNTNVPQSMRLRWVEILQKPTR